MSTSKFATVSEELTSPVGKSSPVRKREDAIRAGVLAALGQPAQLLKVAVLPLWGDNFRVNVWAAQEGVGNSIPNSYFVTADGGGAIVRSEPPIQKVY